MSSPIKYKNKKYKNLLQLYNELKTEDSPSTYQGFRKRLNKVKLVSKAIRKSDKRLRYDYYKNLYLQNKDDKSINLDLFVKRMRKGMKLKHAISRKFYESNKGKKITVEGKNFSSLTQLAKHYNINPDLLYRRYKRGIRGKQLLFGVKNIIKYKNNIYSNKKEFCYKFNISYYILVKGLKLGKSLEKIVEDNKIKKTPIKQTFQNKNKKIKSKNLQNINLPTNFNFNYKHFKTVKELADTVNIDYTTIYRRIKNGSTIEEAVKAGSPRGKYNLKIIVNDKNYNSINDFAIKNNLSRKFLKEHTAKGMSLDQILLNKNSLKRKVGKERKLLHYKNTKITYAEASKKLNLHQSTIMNYLYNNKTKTLEDLESNINIKKERKKITFNNIEYPDLESFITSKNIDIEPSVFKQRLARGFSIKEILKQGKKISTDGRYNLKVLLRNQQLANTPGYLYFLKIKVRQNYLYKIGITKNTIEERVKSLEEISSKDVTILKYKTGKLIDCYKLEQKILKIYSKYKFLDPIFKYTGGRTEIFKLDTEQITEISILME